VQAISKGHRCPLWIQAARGAGSSHKEISRRCATSRCKGLPPPTSSPKTPAGCLPSSAGGDLCRQGWSATQRVQTVAHGRRIHDDEQQAVVGPTTGAGPNGGCTRCSCRKAPATPPRQRTAADASPSGSPGEWNSSSAVYRAASTASRTAVPALGRGWTSRRVRLTEPVERSFIATPAR